LTDNPGSGGTIVKKTRATLPIVAFALQALVGANPSSAQSPAPPITVETVPAEEPAAAVATPPTAEKAAPAAPAATKKKSGEVLPWANKIGRAHV
jgi:hypothetical protein